MKDIYRTYPGVVFKYHHPYTWEGRVPSYLELVEKRKKYQDYMFPPKRGYKCQQECTTSQTNG